MQVSIGASSDFFELGFFDTDGDVAVDVIGDPTPETFSVLNEATGVVTTISGSGFAFTDTYSPLSGTITSMSFSDAEGTPLALVDDISWNLIAFDEALDDMSAMAALINDSGTLTIDASAATAPLDLRSFWFDILPLITAPMDIIGSAQDDRLSGGLGNDTINPGANAEGEYVSDEIWGTPGDDVIDLSGVTPQSFIFLDYGDIQGPLTFDIDEGANTGSVSGSGFVDTIIDPNAALQADGFGLGGTVSDDTFNISREDGDSWFDLLGYQGNDTYNLDMSAGGRLTFTYGAGNRPTMGLVVDLSTGVVSNDGFGGVDQINHLGGSGRLEIRGTRLSDSMIGSSRNESFIAELGNDTVDGGGGFDRVRYDRSGIEQLHVDLATGRASGIWSGEAFLDTLTGVEWVRGTRDHDDTLLGDGADNLFEGFGGDDRIEGGAGNDDIIGGAGADTLNGGDGDDRVLGDDGADTMRGNDGSDELEGGEGNDFINGGKQHDEINGDAGADTLDGANGMDTIRGGDGDDLIFGGRSNDIVSGGDGNDFIRGNEGKDELNGDLGDDYITGGNQDDTLRGSFGSDTLLGQNGFDQISGDDGDDHIDGGNAGDTIDGGAGNDQILGRDGKDELIGGSGNDTLNGGTGDDTLSGGSGNDSFVFKGAWGDDIITDFSANDGEVIDFSGLAKIESFEDLLDNHLRDNGGNAEIYVRDNTIVLQGISVSEIGDGLAYSADDFLF